MWIPEFWCGVLSTLLIEFVLLLGAAIIGVVIQNKKEKEDTDERNRGE